MVHVQRNSGEFRKSEEEWRNLLPTGDSSPGASEGSPPEDPPNESLRFLQVNSSRSGSLSHSHVTERPDEVHITVPDSPPSETCRAVKDADQFEHPLSVRSPLEDLAGQESNLPTAPSSDPTSDASRSEADVADDEFSTFTSSTHGNIPSSSSGDHFGTPGYEPSDTGTLPRLARIRGLQSQDLNPPSPRRDGIMDTRLPLSRFSGQIQPSLHPSDSGRESPGGSEGLRRRGTNMVYRKMETRNRLQEPVEVLLRTNVRDGEHGAPGVFTGMEEGAEGMGDVASQEIPRTPWTIRTPLSASLEYLRYMDSTAPPPAPTSPTVANHGSKSSLLRRMVQKVGGGRSSHRNTGGIPEEKEGGGNATPRIDEEKAREEEEEEEEENLPDLQLHERPWGAWNLFQWGALLLILGALLCTLIFTPLRSITWFGIEQWRWLILLAVVVSGRLMSGWAIKVVVKLVERHYILRRKVLYFVYGLRYAVRNTVWITLIVAVWNVLFPYPADHTVHVMTSFLWCAFAASILRVLEVLAVKWAANSFHRAAYFDRVSEALFHQFVLETLSAPAAHLTDTPYSAEDAWMDAHFPIPTATEGDAGGGMDVPHPEAAMGGFGSTYDMRGMDTHLPQEGLGAGHGEKEETANRQSSDPGPTSDPLPMPDAHIRFPSAPGGVRGEGNRGPGVGLGLPDGMGGGAVEFGGWEPERRGGTRQSYTGFVLSEKRGSKKGDSLPESQQQQAGVKQRKPINLDALQKLTAQNVSAWTMRRLVRIVRKTKISTTVKDVLAADKGEESEIDSELQAKAAAKQIFENMTSQRFLSLESFEQFLPPHHAARAFVLFDGADTGQISRRAMSKWVVGVYKERKALAFTLSDSKTVVAKLQNVLDVILLGVVGIISLLILGVDTNRLLILFSSFFLPAVFMFGNQAKLTFEALVFLFIMHPYDVGDRVIVDGVSMVVEEINLLYTVFLDSHTEKVYFPTEVLKTRPISNTYRSPHQWDSIEFDIPAATPLNKVGKLKDRMQQYLDRSTQIWYPFFRLVCVDPGPIKLKMVLWVQHRINWQDEGERQQRKSTLIFFLNSFCLEAGIEELPLAPTLIKAQLVDKLPEALSGKDSD